MDSAHEIGCFCQFDVRSPMTIDEEHSNRFSRSTDHPRREPVAQRGKTLQINGLGYTVGPSEKSRND